MWRTYVGYTVHLVDGKRHRRVTVQVPETWGWRGAVCRFFTKLGDVLSAGRRKSWVGDRIWAKHLWGFYAYIKIREVLLYGKVLPPSPTRWCCDGKVYII